MPAPHTDRLGDLRRSPFSEGLGIVIEEAAPGRARCRLPWNVAHTTVADVVHGGAILALADVAASAAVRAADADADADPEAVRSLTSQLSMSFLAPARATDLVATATVAGGGRTLRTCIVEIHGANDSLVAHASVACRIGTRRDPAATMQALFAGRDEQEAMALLATLERTGAELYRHWATTRTGAEAAHLLESADREESNARTLDRLTRTGPAA